MSALVGLNIRGYASLVERGLKEHRNALVRQSASMRKSPLAFGPGDPPASSPALSDALDFSPIRPLTCLAAVGSAIVAHLLSRVNAQWAGVHLRTA